MDNFDLNKVPVKDEDVPHREEESNNGIQQRLNNDINLNEFPMPETMPLNESLLEIIRIFTAIYFPIVLRDAMNEK